MGVKVIRGETYAFNIKGVGFDITQVQELQIIIAKSDIKKILLPSECFHIRGENEIQVVLSSTMTLNLELGYHDLEFRWVEASSIKKFKVRGFVNIINSYYEY